MRQCETLPHVTRKVKTLGSLKGSYGVGLLSLIWSGIDRIKHTVGIVDRATERCDSSSFGAREQNSVLRLSRKSFWFELNVSRPELSCAANTPTPRGLGVNGLQTAVSVL